MASGSKERLILRGLGTTATGDAESGDPIQQRMAKAWNSFCQDSDRTQTLPHAKRQRGDTSSEAIFLHEARVSFSALMQWISTLEASKHPDLLEAVFPVLIQLFFRLLDVQLINAAQALITEHGGIFAALSDDSRRTILFLQGIRTKDDLTSENMYTRFRWEGKHQLKVALPETTHRELLEALRRNDLVKLRGMILAVIEAEHSDHQVEEKIQAVAEAKDMTDDAFLINSAKLNVLTDVINPPMAYGNWQGVLAKYHGRNKHSDIVNSAESIEQLGLPLPSGNSPERRRASKRFAKLVMQRELVDPGNLPSTFDFFVNGSAAQDYINCVAVSTDMNYCVAGSSLGAKLWHIAGPVSEINSFQNHPCTLLSHVDGPGDCPVLDAAFCPSNDLLLTAGHGTLALWIVRTANKLAEFPVQRQSEPFWSVDWCPTDHYFVSSGCNGEGLLWSIDELEPVRVFTAPKTVLPVGQQACSSTKVVKCHPSARYVAVASNNSLVMWDLLTARPARIFENSWDTTALTFSKNGTLLAAGRSDGCIDIWNVATGRLQQELSNAHSGAVLALDFSWPDAISSRSSRHCSLLFSSGVDGDMQFWPTISVNEDPVGRPLRRPVPHSASSLGAKSLSAARLVSGVFTPANILLLGRTS